MDYHNKYIKYKKKYVELKYNNNQCGGTGKSICIPNTDGKFLTYSKCNEHLMQVPPAAAPVAPPTPSTPQVVLPATPPTLLTPPVAAPVAAPTVLPVGPLTQPKIIKPWDRNSQLLFIALPIAQDSELGKEINRRIIKVDNSKSPFKDYAKDGKNLYTPHISLIQIFIPENSNLDNLLSNQQTFKRIVEIITLLFINCFNITDVNSATQLHSNQGNYTSLNNWIGRIYDDEKYLKVVSEYNNQFRQSIIKLLLDKISSQHSYEHTDTPPYYSPNGATPTFTHYSTNSQTHEDSEFAISSWFTKEWKPHISLALVTDKTERDQFITDIQYAGNISIPISFINLWNVNMGKKIKTTKGDIIKHGSLEYIYVSYKKYKKFNKI